MPTLTQEPQLTNLKLNKKPKKLPFEKWKGYLGRFNTDKLMEEIRGVT